MQSFIEHCLVASTMVSVEEIGKVRCNLCLTVAPLRGLDQDQQTFS